MKATKFVYVPSKDKLEFQQYRLENQNIIPCSVYIDREEQKIYFVEEQTGEILDFSVNISDKVLGL